MILTVAIVISTLGKVINDKPPIIRLNDGKYYRFQTGSYAISKAFKQQLVAEQLPEIKRVLRCYGIDTIEVIGHTDSSPNSGASNLDQFQDRRKLNLSKATVHSGSNADLGLLRALSVEDLLRRSLGRDYTNISFRSYSAASYVDPVVFSKSSKLSQPQIQQSKRRIEVRFTRSDAAKMIPKC
jgi:outer membrane protein OmpA-like peptidoglycan-associated protein